MERYVVKLSGIHDKTTKHGPHAYPLTTCSIETCNEFFIIIVKCTYVIDWINFVLYIVFTIYYFVRPKSLLNTRSKGKGEILFD